MMSTNRLGATVVLAIFSMAAFTLEAMSQGITLQFPQGPDLVVVAPPPPEFMRPGQHTLVLDIGLSTVRSAEKTYSSTCAPWFPFPGPMVGHVGWGQAEIGWLGENCFAFVLQLAVEFDRSQLDRIPIKTIDRAILTYDERPGASCPLVFGYVYTCWQGGGGEPEDKPMGCVEIRVPSRDWGVPGLIPVMATPSVRRISARQWDVTDPFTWQATGVPLGGSVGPGLLFSGGPTLDQLTAQDSTVCVSAVSNIFLAVTYTVPPDGGPAHGPN